MTLHHLKVLPEFFTGLKDGSKKFEIRLGDRDIKKGDDITFHEYDKDKNVLTGRTLKKRVTYLINTKRLLFWSPRDIEKYGLSIYSLDEITEASSRNERA